MSVTTVDQRTALLVVDLQEGAELLTLLDQTPPQLRNPQGLHGSW